MPDYSGRIDVGNALINIGSQLGQIYVNKLEASEKSGARARWYGQQSKIDGLVSDNINSPEMILSEFDQMQEKAHKDVVGETKTPGARQQIEAEFDIYWASARNSLVNKTSQLIHANSVANYKVNMATLTAPPPAGVTISKDDVAKNMAEVVKHTNDQLKAGNFTELEQDYAENQAAKQIFRHYALQQVLDAKDPEEYLKNINTNIQKDFEEKDLGIENLFSTEDVDELRSEYKSKAVNIQDNFNITTGKTALEWDKKLQAWDDPKSQEKLSFQDINALEMPEFANKFGNEIIKFKEYWRGLLNAKIKAKETGDDTTSISDMIQAERLVRSVGSRRIPLDKALTAYTEIAPNIKSTDNKSYIAKLFAAEETTRVPVKQIMNDKLSDRQTKVRDAIEQQPNFLVESEGKEVLQDLANQAVLELGDRYGDLEWEDDKDLDSFADNLIRKYSPSAQALNMMVLNKQLLQAETFEQQQKKFQEMYESLRKQGKNTEADRLLEEMITLGLAQKDGKPSKGKKDKLPGGSLKRIWDAIR